MKRFPVFEIVVLLSFATCCDSVNAQTSGDSTSRSHSNADSLEAAYARSILDLPGTSDLDPDETLEYLDGLNALADRGLARLHADPNISWTEAHAMVRAGRRAQPLRPVGEVQFRSRGSEPLDPKLQSGFVTGQYLGTSVAYINQVRARSSLLSVGGCEAKQAWEPTFTEHLGGYIMLANPVTILGSLRIEQLIAGDYSLAFGNGLGFGGGFSRSSARGAATAVESRSYGLRGSFLNSPRTLRGGAMEIADGATHLYVFTSQRAIDANVVNDTIRTIYSDALHQTQSQLETANAATLSVIGARAELATRDTACLYLKGGATAYELSYDHPFAGSSSSQFYGRTLAVAGADVLAVGEHWSASAESALSKNDTVHRLAGIFTAVFTPKEHLSFSLLYRHVPDGFQSPFGEVLGVGTYGITNFDGYYVGLEFEPIENRLRLNTYVDLESELLPLHDLFGSRKHDYLVSASLAATSDLELKAILRDQQNATVLDSGHANYVTVRGEITHLRFEATYRPGKSSALFRAQFEEARYALTNVENGWAATEEVVIPSPRLRSEFQMIATRFETGAPNAAMWLYGSGVPGTASINPFDGLGWRLSLRATVRALETLSCSAYLAGTIYDTPHALGSGLSARTGTADLTATVQIDVRL